jgi:hypothetical protein
MLRTCKQNPSIFCSHLCLNWIFEGDIHPTQPPDKVSPHPILPHGFRITFIVVGNGIVEFSMLPSEFIELTVTILGNA